jgi:hypothetical protein
MDVLDLVVAEHALLLIYFKLRKTYKIIINGGGRKYFIEEGTIIVKLPPGIKIAKVRIRSLWRTHSEHITLRRIALDEDTSRTLIQSLYSMQLPTVYPFHIACRNIGVQLRKTGISLKKSNPTMKIPRVSINQEQLSYVFNEP